MKIAAAANRAAHAPAAASPTRTARVVMVDVHGPVGGVVRPTDGAPCLLEAQQPVDEFLGHVVMPETDALGIARLAVRARSSRGTDRRVFGYGFALSALSALDNSASDHFLNDTVCSLLAQWRQRLSLPLLLIVPRTEPTRPRCSHASAERTPRPLHHRPSGTDWSHGPTAAVLRIVSRAQPSREPIPVRRAIARPPLASCRAHVHVQPPSRRHPLMYQRINEPAEHVSRIRKQVGPWPPKQPSTEVTYEAGAVPQGTAVRAGLNSPLPSR